MAPGQMDNELISWVRPILITHMTLIGSPLRYRVGVCFSLVSRAIVSIFMGRRYFRIPYMVEMGQCHVFDENSQLRKLFLTKSTCKLGRYCCRARDFIHISYRYSFGINITTLIIKFWLNIALFGNVCMLLIVATWVQLFCKFDLRNTSTSTLMLSIIVLISSILSFTYKCNFLLRSVLQ